jgi:hypothetical protein
VVFGISGTKCARSIAHSLLTRNVVTRNTQGGQGAEDNGSYGAVEVGKLFRLSKAPGRVMKALCAYIVLTTACVRRAFEVGLKSS